jgi:lariat debranching enzyme
MLTSNSLQATRNKFDLDCMAVPPKYKHMGDFYHYYTGVKVAPILTLFIHGNHEAGNHLQELYDCISFSLAWNTATHIILML